MRPKLLCFFYLDCRSSIQLRAVRMRACGSRYDRDCARLLLESQEYDYDGVACDDKCFS
jgi:hypothetical protein